MAAAALLVLCVTLVTMVIQGYGKESNKVKRKWLPALHRRCLKCICEAATECSHSVHCKGGYCGPFGISRIYWVEAEKPVLDQDDPDRDMAYEDCANLYKCATRIVKAYMTKLAKDCNEDELINCDDFAMMHFNGGYICNKPLNRSEMSRNYLKRYLKCRGPIDDDDPFGKAIRPGRG